MASDIKNENDEFCFYELTFLLSAEDTKLIENVVAESGGSVINTQPITRIQLAYPIRGERFAFLGVAVCSLPRENVRSLRRLIGLQSSVLRHMLTKPIVSKKPPRLEKSADAAISSSLGKEKSETRSEDNFRRKGNPSPVSELTNEDIEKKIEEILQ